MIDVVLVVVHTVEVIDLALVAVVAVGLKVFAIGSDSYCKQFQESLRIKLKNYSH